LTKLLAIGGLILWLLSHGSIVFGETDAAAEYFPLADGNSWTYRVTGTSGTYNETMTVLPGTTIINGVATKVIQYSGGNIDYFTSDINGIQLHRGYAPSTPPITTWTFSPPLVITYGTMSVPEIINSSGIVWLTHETAGTFSLNYTATSETEVREAVSVPAGTYEAVRLRDSTRMYGNIQWDEIDFREWGNTWMVKHIGMIKQTLYDDDGKEEEWVMTSTNVVPNDPILVDLSGTIKTSNGNDICAMVLASGQHMFSCNPWGEFSLTDLSRRSDGTVKRQIYAHGFFPRINVLTGSSIDEAVVMTRSGTCPNYNAPSDPGFFPDSAGNWIDISGNVLLQNTQTPVCAMVLASGQHMFSCDGTGSYDLHIPLNSNGQYKLQVYADGFAPAIQRFDEFSTNNTVKMTRAIECQAP
jgi:hypothetical protein